MALAGASVAIAMHMIDSAHGTAVSASAYVQSTHLPLASPSTTVPAPVVPKCSTLATPPPKFVQLQSALPSGFELATVTECTDIGTYYRAVLNSTAGGQVIAVMQKLSGPAPSGAQVVRGAPYSTGQFADGSIATEIQLGPASQAILVTPSGEMINLRYVPSVAPTVGAAPTSIPVSAAQLATIADEVR